ncbi:MAG: Sua5/YciO/YrdC/YwlC family protein [Gammaproteobacteria bacterium]
MSHPPAVTATTYLSPRLRYAAAVIRAGGVVAYPTEGVYGLGCRPDDATAVDRILLLKERPVTAGLILIAANLEQLNGWISPTPGERHRLYGSIAAADGGPVTWVVRAGPLTPVWISGGRETVAVRVTRHPVAANLCLATDMPLVSTSANRHGKAPARTATGARARFGGQISLVVGGAIGDLAGPTPIRLASSGEYLRAG